ncbi:MAG TPA: ElyC/SanA/YdcF family protein [Chthoniobacterales bacterium]|jgi:SanA protein
MKRWIARLLRLAALAVGAVVLGWLLCELAVEIAAWGRCYDRLELVPARKVGLVLGTSKYLTSGGPNLHYQYRIDAAAELFKAGKVEKLIVSGNGTDAYYNEPRMMREDLVARGVPADRILSDEAGLRTFDSVVRAAEVFGAPDCIVVSQPSHNERAIFIGRTRGQDMIGWNARIVDARTDPRTAIRERLARVLAVIDVLDVALFNEKPTLTPSGKALSRGASAR